MSNFNKYTVLAIVTLFWIIAPFVFMLLGITGWSYLDVQELTQLENPTVLNVTYVFINWFGFFFRVLTFSLPNVPLLVEILLFCFIPLEALAIVSVFRGD